MEDSSEIKSNIRGNEWSRRFLFLIEYEISVLVCDYFCHSWHREKCDAEKNLHKRSSLWIPRQSFYLFNG